MPIIYFVTFTFQSFFVFRWQSCKRTASARRDAYPHHERTQPHSRRSVPHKSSLGRWDIIPRSQTHCSSWIAAYYIQRIPSLSPGTSNSQEIWLNSIKQSKIIVKHFLTFWKIWLKVLKIRIRIMPIFFVIAKKKFWK